MIKEKKKEKKQFTHPLVRYWIKLTGFLLATLFLRPRVFFENKKLQRLSLKGGVLIVSNHRSFWDYISYFNLFIFHLVRPVVSYEIYHKNKLLTFFLNMIGAIPLSENPMDFSWMQETIKLLKKGKKVIIFPEAHFIEKDELATFHSSYVLIAKQAGVPILPLYTDGNYCTWKRNKVAVGARIDISKLPTKNREEINSVVVNKIQSLGELTKRMEKHHFFSFKNILWDLGRIMVYIHIGFLLRIKVVGKNGKILQRKNGPYIIAANHIKLMDPLALLCVFWRRRVRMLTADVVFGKNKKLRSFLLKQGGCVKINRESLDLEAVSSCCKSLKRGYPLIIFPEGHVETHDKIDSLKSGVSMIASRSSCPIIPVYISYGKKWYNRTKVYFGNEIEPSKDKTMKGISLMTESLSEEFLKLKDVAEKKDER